MSQADIAAVEQKLRAVHGVAGVTANGSDLPERLHSRRWTLILHGDPLNKSSLDVVPRMRDAVADLPSGVTALVGGSSAINYDIDNANQHDLELIAPLALLVMAVILAILLQALVAPLALAGQRRPLVRLHARHLDPVHPLRRSAMPASTPRSRSSPSSSWWHSGIDYTIFLMARVREEARKHGTREGMLRALAATGPVITSAGVILAGTFSVLMTLPVSFTFDLGFMVALGILLDTFIVRTIMVPAAVELLGDKVWWPSTASAGGRLREETGEHVLPEPSEAG